MASELIVPGGVTSSSDLSDIRSALEAEDLSAVLSAAYRAFEWALRALRGAEDQAGPLLSAFVLAAAAAANGRDAVAATRSFPGPGSAPPGDVASLVAADVADQVAGLSLALFTRLRAAADGDYACLDAAVHAQRMHELLAPSG